MLTAVHSCFGTYIQEGRSSELQASQPNFSAREIYAKSPSGFHLQTGQVPIAKALTENTWNLCTVRLPNS